MGCCCKKKKNDNVTSNISDMNLNNNNINTIVNNNIPVTDYNNIKKINNIPYIDNNNIDFENNKDFIGTPNLTYENMELNNNIQEVNVYNNKNPELNEQLKEIDKIKNEKNKYKNENCELNKKIKDLNIYKDENDELKNTINIYKNENNELNKQIQNLNTYKNENDDLKNTINIYKNENNELNKQIQNLNFDKYTLNNELNKTKIEFNEYKNASEMMSQQMSLYTEGIFLNEPNLVGLDNIGAICYLNAILQSLSNTKKLSDYFLKEYQYYSNNNKIMSNEFFLIVKNLWDRNNHNSSISPINFNQVLIMENPLFNGLNDCEPKELIVFLLERFHQELNVIDEYMVLDEQEQFQNEYDENNMLNSFLKDFKIKFNSIISNLFCGVIETKNECQECNNTKYNFTSYNYIDFNLKAINKYCILKGLKNNSDNIDYNNIDIDLYECFNYYCDKYLRIEDNQEYCNICQKNCDTFYSLYFYSLPNYLIINLNRGKENIYQYNVSFPEKLNLLNFVTFADGNTYFELYAVICKDLNSMTEHFIAYCKNSIDKNWYKYNDSIIEPCNQKNLYLQNMPYILFYQAP